MQQCGTSLTMASLLSINIHMWAKIKSAHTKIHSMFSKTKDVHKCLPTKLRHWPVQS